MNATTAATLFGVSDKHVSDFSRIDPFNNHLVTGFICRKRNQNGGSLVITSVNGVATQQVIWATPKLAYPYKPDSTDLMDFSNKVVKYYFAEKWNGMNVLFYKYVDNHGQVCITAKSKGTPFIGDSDVGNFLSLLKEAMLTNDYKESFDDFVEDPDVVAISYELCGTKEPHLVNYEFQIELKPLFVIKKSGNISPIINIHEKSNGVGNFQYSFAGYVNAIEKNENIHKRIRNVQDRCFFENEQYRRKNGLSIKYEYNHFLTEGMVLYLLDRDDNVIDNVMYKIKPKDIEEVHWARFDESMEARVKEAIDKCNQRGYNVDLENIKEELDMGPKEWSKFGKSIEKYLKENQQ
jgi:hypothetical protein